MIVVVRQVGNLVELEGVVHLPFAEVSLVVHRRDMDVGRNALDLRAFAVGAIELLNRQLEGAPVGRAAPAIAAAHVVADHDDLLDGSFTEGARIADDQAPVVIADHAGEDLGGAGAELVDQDDERAIPGGAFLIVVVMLDAEDFLDLDDGAGVDEETGEGLGFVEQAAAVPTEIDDDGVDTVWHGTRSRSCGSRWSR